MEMEAIKKTNTEATPEMENLDKRTRTTDALSAEFKRGKRKSSSKTQ